VLSLTFFNFFVNGGLALAIPLLLLERKVSLGEIGLVISILPLVFLFVRLVFGYLADQRGWRPFFFLATLLLALSSAIFYAADSVSTFLLGKVMQGAEDSAYWAVNRTATYSLCPKREQKEATRMRSIMFIATASGSAAAGVGIFYAGFSSTLILMVLASALMAIPAVMLWKMGKKDSQGKAMPSLVSSKPRDKQFWAISIVMVFYSLASYPMIYLVLPLFMSKQLGYNYITIGAAFMLFNLLYGFVTLATLKRNLGLKRVVLQTAVVLLAVFPMVAAGYYFPAFLLTLASGYGLAIGFFESIIAKATRDRPGVSLDIGVLSIPTRLAEFASVLSAGFVIQFFGYFPMFVASGVFFAVFSLSALYVLKLPSRQNIA
jgi:MFS family permease